MFYLLQNSDGDFAMVSSDQSADGWYSSIAALDLELTYCYNFNGQEPIANFQTYDRTLLHTFTTRPTHADLLTLFPEHYL